MRTLLSIIMLLVSTTLVPPRPLPELIVETPKEKVVEVKGINEFLFAI